MDIFQLKSEYERCVRCSELVKSRTQVVFGSKHMRRCPILIIGEAPGQREDEFGEPFVGRSGQLLNMFLSEIGLTRDDVFITNTVLCRPPNNRNPRAEELRNCRERLDMTISLINPKIIITLGNFATHYVLETDEGITRLRGRIFEKAGRKIMPLPHPATLLYSGLNPEKMKLMREDFTKIKGLIDGR